MKFIRKQLGIQPSQSLEGPNVTVEIDLGEHSWDNKDFRNDENPKRLKSGHTYICGSVGCGKSSLLCSIFLVGLKVFGSKAFVPQSAWIETGMIRENILLGRKINKGFCDELIDGCDLARDFETLIDSDLSIEGERGLNLIGGQKHCIQLARAL
ncbi:putative ABC transporter C family member 15 [Tanacetum coccineum]